MKILIAADMEGISGVVDRSHVDSQSGAYSRFRSLMTGDVNAAVKGAKTAGADEIWVVDGHGGGKNILLEDLDPAAELITGSPRPTYMLTGIDENIDAVLFIGYHARAGTSNAILSHTISSMKIQHIRLNGRPIGEIGLNAALCGYFNVPVLMISSDQAGCHEASEWITGIRTVETKKATGRLSAICRPVKQVQDTIREISTRCVHDFQKGNSPSPLKTEIPVEIQVEFKSESMADSAGTMPGAERASGYTIMFQADNILEAYKHLGTAINLA